MEFDRSENRQDDLRVILYSVGIWAGSLVLIGAFGVAMRLLH
jgi:hypothetical protein